MLGLLSLPKLTSSSGDEWMTSSRVGHSLTDGGHVLQDMKEAMMHEGGVRASAHLTHGDSDPDYSSPNMTHSLSQHADMPTSDMSNRTRLSW